MQSKMCGLVLNSLALILVGFAVDLIGLIPQVIITRGGAQASVCSLLFFG